MSSLGVGEPESLAKNLENILSLLSEEEGGEGGKEEIELKTPVMKKRIVRKPKLEEINIKYPKALEELTSRTLKQLPKITISEESPTPRKFFKSKDMTNQGNLLPDFRKPKMVPASAVKKGAKSFSKSVKNDLSSMEPKKAKLKQPMKNPKSLGSFAIYDDSQCKTPLKDQGNDELARPASKGRAGARSPKKALVDSEEMKRGKKSVTNR